MQRLRQTDRVTKGTIIGSMYDKNLKLTTARYRYDIEADGHAQAVLDTWPPCKIADLKRLKVPELHAVKMSKVTLHVPAKQSVVNYRSENASQRAVLCGPNLALVGVQRSVYDSLMPPYATNFTTVNDSIAGYLYQRALSRASSAEFDFGVTVGEIAETAAFLASPLKSLVSLSNKAFKGISVIRTVGGKTAIRIAKNASKKSIRQIMANTTAASPLQPSLRFLDESANHWLAYKFGVLPILDDIQKTLDFKEKNIARQLGVRIARVKGLKSDVSSVRLDNGTFWNQFTFDLMRVKRVEDRHTFGLYFRNQITDPLVNFMEGLGFSAFSPLTLAWELIPLSFVVDRFIDIKSFTRGNLGGLSKDILSYYCSRKIQTTYASSVSNVKFDSYLRVPCQADQTLQAQATSEQLTRVVNLDRPKFPVINPHWQQQLTADATNLSLIWGRLRTFVGRQHR